MRFYVSILLAIMLSVMDARTDRRQIHYQDQPEVREHARTTTSQILRLRIELAKDLWSLDQTAAFLAESCSSVGHFAARTRAWTPARPSA